MFGHAGGRTMFRSDSESRDRNMIKYDMPIRSNMQLRSSNDFENMPDLGSTVQSFEQGMGYQNQLNENLGIPHTASRNLSSALSLHQGNNLRLNSIIDSMPHKRNISTVSKTFGLISEEENVFTTQNNGRYSSYLKGSGSFNSSVIPRPFGFQSKTSTSQSDGFTQNGSRLNQDKSIMNFRSTLPRNFLDSDNLGALIRNHNEGFHQELKRNPVNSSVLSSGLVHNSGRGLRFNQDLNLRNNSTIEFSKTFGSAVRNPTGFNIQEKVDSTYNTDVIENGSFRKPTLSRVIRGRSSISASRLFQNQKIKQHCKDLSNINGYNVSHISSRDVDNQSNSRLQFNSRSNWMDNQSMSGSVLSVTSLKFQFMNLLENLHHSILNMAPQVTAEAVRMEFDRAKQTLENISEMSFVSSVKESILASEIHQPSTNTYPTMTKPTASTCIDGGSLNLKSSKDLLQSFFSCKCTDQDKFNSTTHKKDDERKKLSTVSYEKTNDEESVFKKPQPYIKNKSKRRSSRMLKIKVSNAVESLTSVAKNKAVNLKEWYPVAVGSNLALCGINEEGATVKTDAVKKRLNHRKVELINGLICNLIGSPSSMVSVLPKKIMSLLKDGLTNKWRMLQQELINCQTAEEERKTKRVSKSPNARGSPGKKKEKSPKVISTSKMKEKSPKVISTSKMKEKSPKVISTSNMKEKSPKVISSSKKKEKSPKVISTSKKKEKVEEVRTKSGRIIKPPSMFWVAANSNKVSSTINNSISEINLNNEQSEKRIVSTKETPVKKLKKATHESSIKTQENLVESSPKKKQKYQSVKNSKKEESERKKRKKNKRDESEEEDRVHSSREDTKKKSRDQKTQGKRKRDANGESESVLAKKSKLEKSIEPEVKSTPQASESFSKKGKVIVSSSPVLSSRKKQIYTKKTINESTNRFEKQKSRLALDSSSPKLKGKKSVALKKENAKKKTKSKSERKTETKELNESGEDFELKLDEIEIPEIASVNMNPQLSRSQMKLISMETPPLKYFNTHLRLMRSSITPVRSPDWCLSQRTESEVKQFQKRMEGAFKKKIKVNMKKTKTETFMTEKNITSKSVQNRDVKRVMEWVAEKTVRSPSWNSKVLQYVIPSRKQREEQNNEEDEDAETDFF